MPFNKKQWVDRLVEHPGRFEYERVHGQENAVDITRAEGAVAHKGDSLDAHTMNDLERRIEEAALTLRQQAAAALQRAEDAHTEIMRLEQETGEGFARVNEQIIALEEKVREALAEANAYASALDALTRQYALDIGHDNRKYAEQLDEATRGYVDEKAQHAADSLANVQSSLQKQIDEIEIDNGIAGTVPVARGGTGRETLTSNMALVGNGANAVEMRPLTATPASGSADIFTAGGAHALQAGISANATNVTNLIEWVSSVANDVAGKLPLTGGTLYGNMDTTGGIRFKSSYAGVAWEDTNGTFTLRTGGPVGNLYLELRWQPAGGAEYEIMSINRGGEIHNATISASQVRAGVLAGEVQARAADFGAAAPYFFMRGITVQNSGGSSINTRNILMRRV